MMIPGFGSIIVEDDEYAAINCDAAPVEVIEAQPIPELPAEVWHTTEASGDERMRAVRALSRAA